MYYRRNSRLRSWIINHIEVILLSLIVILTVGVLSGSIWLDYRAPETVKGAVVDEYIKRYDEKDLFHIVIELENGSTEIFQNRDAFWLGKFNSADMQQLVEIGSNYIFEVRGTRVPILSKFRNVTKITKQ